MKLIQHILPMVFLFFKTQLEQEKKKLSSDLDCARELSHRVIADRLQLQEEKALLVQQLAEMTKLTNLLEAQLRKLVLALNILDYVEILFHMISLAKWTSCFG